MDARNIMRQGPAWNIAALSIADQCIVLGEFHRLARLNGSGAVWIGKTGEIVAKNPEEASREFPYEEWALAAYRHIRTVWEHEAIWHKAGNEAPPSRQLH